MDLAGKYCLITGGSSGIGLAIAKELRRQGAHLALLARDQGKLDEARRTLTPLGEGKIELVSADLEDGCGCIGKIDELVQRTSLPDLLINNAGMAHPSPFVGHPEEQMKQMMQCNFFAHWRILQHLVPLMLKRGSGCIVNVASMAGLLGIYGYSGYAASKGAMVLFSQVLRNELEPQGLKVFLLCPGDTLTPQLEAENLIKPAETKKIAASSPPMTAEAVARVLIGRLRRGTGFYVVPGWMNRLSWQVYRWLPGLIHRIIDGDVYKVRRTRPSSR